MNPGPGLSPVSSRERIVALDVIRALALFGVLWMNFPEFSGARTLGVLGHPLGHGWLDAWAGGVGSVLVRGKAMACFSLLFGIGLFIQFDRAQARGARASAFALRRLGGLFLIGFLHWVLVWQGDVLTTYALAGFLLLALLKARARTFILLAIGFMLLGDGVPMLVKALHLPAALDLFNHGGSQAAQADAAFGHGAWPACVGLRLRQWGSLHILGMALIAIPYALPMFLIGALLWRKGVPQDPTGHARMLKALFHGNLWLGLAVSFLASDPFHLLPKTWMKVGQGTPWWLLTDLGCFTLALGYVSGLLRLLDRPAWMRRMAFLAPMGRMALTNYLSQSLVFTWLFYGHGLGLWGRVRPGAALGIVLGFYALQVLWSAWWLARFRFGPAEWVWRSMTYGRRQPFRLEPTGTAPVPAIPGPSLIID